MIAWTPPRGIDKWLPLLACPHCHGSLELFPESCRCSGCAGSFPVREGCPVFVEDPEQVRVVPEGHFSNQLTPDVLDWLTWMDGVALNIGAGGTKVKLESCIELEHAIFRNTDVVGDAHHLPFADAVFDAVVTFNTFEHLSDPPRAAREIYRVLKPGGKLVLHTAFLQPVHEPPYHFYNTTEYGLREWFRDYEISELMVSDNFNPAYVLAWLSSEIIRAVEAEQGPEAARRLADSPLAVWRSSWEDAGCRSHPCWDILRRLSQEAQKRFSAGFHLEAFKPTLDEGACS